MALMPPKFAIQPLTADRIDESIAVIVRAFDPTYEDSAREELRWSLSEPSYYRPDSFVAVADGKVAGFIQCAANYAHPDTFSIGWVAVDPTHQRQGIGRALVDHAEAHIAKKMLKGKRGTILIVDDTRLKNPGTDFYLRRGYEDGPLTHKGMHVMVKIVNPA